MKYHTPKSGDEVLPNNLGLSDPDKIAEEEYRGFLRAEIEFESQLDQISTFDWTLICSIHKTALHHLYEFAGELRQVNLSKGGFLFPAARFLPSIVAEFEEEFLKPLPKVFEDYQHLVKHVAPFMLNFFSSIRSGKEMDARPGCLLT